jgi:L-ascorbate metabolism protein UlaG (beta-lactamase superfamily)
LGIENVMWIGHASFIIKENGMNIFVDPFRIQKDFGKADVLLITHAHMDHYSKDDIAKIIKEDTKVVCSPGTMTTADHKHVTIARPGFKGKVAGLELEIEAIPAYNTKEERLAFHPRANDWVGFVLTVGGKRIYHAGDTDFVEEMKGLKNIDLALLPAGGGYTMGDDEMIAAANAIGAKNSAPIHYKALLGESGSAALETKFKNSVRGGIILREIEKAYYSF